MPSNDPEQPYRRIFEAVSDGLIVNDIETGLVVEANPAAGALHGYAHEDFIGLHPTVYMHPENYAQFARWVQSAQTGKVFEATVVHIRQDGTPFTAQVRGAGFTYRNRLCLLSVVRDVSAPYQQAQALAALEERRRLAQNLHDAVNQSLFSASLIAEVLPRLWRQHPEAVQESLEDLRRLTRGALAEMRGLLVELQPLELADHDLDDLVRLLGDALTGRTNIPVTVTTSGQGGLPAEVQIAFYRLCQEALNNIAKHSRAGQVVIHLRYDDGTVTLTIKDNGRGFDPELVPSGHYGLSIMQERAQAIGATLSITSQLGQGAEIVVRWTEAAE